MLYELARRPWFELSAAHYLDEYEASEWLAPGPLAALQQAKLRRLLWACVLRVPAYKARLRSLSPARIATVAITDLPVTPIGEWSSDPGFLAIQEEDPTIPEGELERFQRERAAREQAIRARSRAWGAPEPSWWQLPDWGVIGAPCGDAPAGAVHAHADHILVESVGGRLVLTDFHERTRPRLRIDVGVKGRLVDRACACGRGLPLVEIEGGSR
jgi:phenylacetate-coenzyme A ligase PaaK-like adenylate-forming protein